jgi:RES domain-containing protein
LKQHPESDRLTRAVERCLSLVGPWTGDVYRFAAPRWATETELLTGAGALRAGGRWHPVGHFTAVYASLDPETALAESLAHQRRYGLAIRDAMPKTLNSVTANLHHVLDLTSGPVRQRLVLSWKRILEEKWWEHEANDEEAVTQALGRVAWEAGLEGLLVPSAARKEGTGLVYFPDNKDARSTLDIINPDELPRTVP